jgi:ABC-2 type transport system ATP-binding protein
MLTGLLTPNEGRVIVNGIDLHDHMIKAKMQMGVIPEVGTTYVDLTAEQNLALTGKYYGLSRERIRERTKELLGALGLYERRGDPVRTYSKGMRQRLSFACAIIHEPNVLFLDEPTEGLDVQSRRLLVDMILELNMKGCTIFLTTHNIEEANALCQRVAIINKGRLVALDRPEALRSSFEKTQSLEVSFDPRIATDTLCFGHVSKIETSGDKMILYTDDPHATIKQVVDVAQQEHARILSLRTRGPSLEEAFIMLTDDKRPGCEIVD